MFEELDFLSEMECLDYSQTIYSLRKDWTSRFGGLFPAYTLGTASYLDAGDKVDIQYRQKAEKSNILLKKHFASLYEKLLKIIEQAIGIPTQYAEGLALPGFHIFLSNPYFEFDTASCHFDLQYQSIQWTYQQIDFDHPISFTVPLRLPQGGGGLYYWNIFYQSLKNHSPEVLQHIRQTTERHFFPYHLGKIILHKDLFLHQIAPGKELSSEDDRITLQGHGLICDGILRLYW